MVVKQKGGKRKPVVRHPADTAPQHAEPEKKPSLPPRSVVSTRSKEANAGFGVLKGVAAVIILLVIGSAILFNRAGGREAMRGDKAEWEECEDTVECKHGSICFAYNGDNHRCMKTCSNKHPCASGETCISAAASKRKGIRVRQVCVPDEAE